MKQSDFLNKLEETYRKNVEISRCKNSDYADSDDAFKNFKACESFGITIEQGLMVRILDKVVRAGNLLQRSNKVLDEKLADTLSDLSNYAAIMKIVVEEKEKLSTVDLEKKAV